jgi:ribosome biogenesis SPOUT family RNA methylase Rps3
MALANQIENRILIAGSMAVTILAFWIILRLFIVPTYTAQIAFQQQQIEKQNATIVELAKIAKYAINNDFEKMRTKKGGSIVLDLNNKMDVESRELIIPDGVVVDSAIFDTPEKSLWKQIFGK